MTNTQTQLANAKQELAKLFRRRGELQEKLTRLGELNAMLNLDKRDNEVVDGEVGEEQSSEIELARSAEVEIR